VLAEEVGVSRGVGLVLQGRLVLAGEIGCSHKEEVFYVGWW
jgi:hypothetical protein